MSATYRIAPSHLSELEARLTKLAKRAAKLGCDPLTWTVGEAYRILDPDTHEPHVYVDVDVTGTTPRYAGWTFVASIEQYGDDLLITTPPDETVPSDFDRSALAQTCDHCRANRRRKQTFLLRHEDGRTVRVGSTCIKDFLGHNFPAVSLFQALRELDEYAGGLGGGSGEWCPDLSEYLTAVAMHIRVGGFMSRSRAEVELRSSTADQVLGWYNARAKGKRVDQPTDDDAEMAARVLSWALALGEPDNDYLINVSVVARAGFVTMKTAGIAASFQSAAGRAWEREARDKAARNLTETSEHFGEVGERGTWNVTVLGCYTTEGYYGTTWIYKFATTDGNAVTWFSTRNAEVDVGESYWLTGTVKKHDRYRGTAETHVSRCRLSTEPPKPRRRRCKAAPKPPCNPNVKSGEDLSIEPEGDGCWVWGTSTYPGSSVLAGQCRRRRIECFETIDKARAEYPTATVCDHAGSAWANREERYSFERSVQPGWFDPADAGESW